MKENLENDLKEVTKLISVNKVKIKQIKKSLEK